MAESPERQGPLDVGWSDSHLKISSGPIYNVLKNSYKGPIVELLEKASSMWEAALEERKRILADMWYNLIFSRNPQVIPLDDDYKEQVWFVFVDIFISGVGRIDKEIFDSKYKDIEKLVDKAGDIYREYKSKVFLVFGFWTKYWSKSDVDIFFDNDPLLKFLEAVISLIRFDKDEVRAKLYSLKDRRERFWEWKLTDRDILEIFGAFGILDRDYRWKSLPFFRLRELKCSLQDEEKTAYKWELSYLIKNWAERVKKGKFNIPMQESKYFEEFGFTIYSFNILGIFNFLEELGKIVEDYFDEVFDAREREQLLEQIELLKMAYLRFLIREFNVWTELELHFYESISWFLSLLIDYINVSAVLHSKYQLKFKDSGVLDLVHIALTQILKIKYKTPWTLSEKEITLTIEFFEILQKYNIEINVGDFERWIDTFFKGLDEFLRILFESIFWENNKVVGVGYGKAYKSLLIKLKELLELWKNINIYPEQVSSKLRVIDWALKYMK